MHRSGWNQERIVLGNGNALQIRFQCSLCQRLPQPFRCHGVPESIDQTGIRLCFQHIPHFRFSVLSVFILLCIGIIRMHLHGQVFFRINQLDENRKFSLWVGICSQIFRMFLQHRPQRFPCCCTGIHHAAPIRMCGALPRFRQWGQINLFMILCFQSFSAPEVIFPHGTQ